MSYDKMADDDESGMRHRHNNGSQNNAAAGDFAFPSSSHHSGKKSSSQTHFKSSEPNSPVNQSQQQQQQQDNNTAAPLLNNSFDVTTQRTYDENSGAAASSSSQQSSGGGGGVLSSISAFGRKAKCKIFDKLPISWVSRFATPAPSPARIALIRKFIDTHVHPVASATAEADGLTPRSSLHSLMIKTLWERLNDKAPRCVRRSIGEEDATIDDQLRGSVWGKFGFQGKDPATDFRAGGALCLEHILHFVTKHPRLLQRIAETPPDHAPVMASYPWAVASINVTGLLLDMLKAVTKVSDNAEGTGDVQAAAKNMTGAFHVGTYSAMEARRKLATFMTDPLAVWRPQSAGSFSSTADNLPWTHKQFTTQGESKMNDLFAPVVVASLGADVESSNNSNAAAASSSSTNNSQQAQQQSQEEREMHSMAERLACVHIATCVLLHEEWQKSSRSILKYNEVWKGTCARLELLLRDSSSFAATMNELWRDE